MSHTILNSFRAQTLHHFHQPLITLEITENEITEDEITEDEVTEDEVTEDELTENEVTEDEITEDEVTEDELTENELTGSATIRNSRALIEPPSSFLSRRDFANAMVTIVATSMEINTSLGAERRFGNAGNAWAVAGNENTAGRVIHNTGVA